MPLPAELTVVSVHGRWLKDDGAPETGQVEFTPSVRQLAVPVANAIVTLKAFVATLDVNGEVTVQLPATDDADVTPTGWTWQIQERLSQARRDRTISVPAATAPGILELSDIADAAPGPVVTSYALQAALAAEEAARIAADALKASVASVTPGAWLPFTFNAGAGNPGVAPVVTAPAGRIEASVSGRVGFRGAIGISGAGFTSGAVIGQVHADLRPSEPRVGTLRVRGNTSTHTNWLVNTNGDFSVTTTALTAGTDVPLDGVTYAL